MLHYLRYHPDAREERLGLSRLLFVVVHLMVVHLYREPVPLVQLGVVACDVCFAYWCITRSAAQYICVIHGC